jgi:hypothetical protein
LLILGLVFGLAVGAPALLDLGLGRGLAADAFILLALGLALGLATGLATELLAPLVLGLVLGLATGLAADGARLRLALEAQLAELDAELADLEAEFEAAVFFKVVLGLGRGLGLGFFASDFEFWLALGEAAGLLAKLSAPRLMVGGTSGLLCIPTLGL